jgi:hypothetical protein
VDLDDDSGGDSGGEAVILGKEERVEASLRGAHSENGELPLPLLPLLISPLLPPAPSASGFPAPLEGCCLAAVKASGAAPLPPRGSARLRAAAQSRVIAGVSVAAGAGGPGLPRRVV